MKYYIQIKSVYSIKNYLLLPARVSYKILAFLILLIFLPDCSVERNTATTRFYNSLTARYNIYFNGYESYKAGIQKISSGYRDDFSEMLRVFESSDPSTVSMCSSDMDRAIQKASKLISLKSITSRPEFDPDKDLSEKERALTEQKEFNDWVDDSYFLIGRARYFRHEYDDAAAVFSYCINEANDPGIRTESSVWLARVNIEKGNYSESARLLKEVEITPSSDRTLKEVYYTTLADMFIRQKSYQEAIEPLSMALASINGKRSKYRLTYLLAQLYEKTGAPDKAIELYRNVVKMNPPYDVEFNARINIAGVFDVSSGDPAEIRKELERMLKDSKNKDFMDQIYYALGNLMVKEGKINEALYYYVKSASSSSVNQNQKGKSYLALADYYYNKPDYMKAGRYYDSTIYFLDQKYPNYNDLKIKSQNLNSLVEHLNVIATEDSLQKVAAMPENERDALISGIIDKIVKAESEGKSSEYADRTNIGQYYENERRFQDNISQEGKWYFYNQTALNFGRTEFRRRWGDRRLEDNWRRSNKASVSVQQASNLQDEETGAKKDTSQAAMDYKKPEFYLKNLPVNDSLIAVSNEKIVNAYFNAGRVFADRIGDKQKAAEAYETLLQRFPGSEIAPEASYELYKIYKDSNNPKSEITRQRLLEKYPDSEFAHIISDPEYFNKKMAETRKVESLYERAFYSYQRDQFNETIAICDSTINIYPEDNLVPKFMLLKAYSVARTSDERTYKQELNKLIEKWPQTEEGKRAAELSAYINKKLPELKIEEDKIIAAEIYVSDTTALYTFVVIIMNPSLNMNQASFDVISYNIDNYTNKNYNTQSSLVDNKYIKITVSGFSDNRQAWEYYRAFQTQKIIRNISGNEIMTFLINGNNLKELDKDKNPERYDLFFKENYLTRQKNR